MTQDLTTTTTMMVHRAMMPQAMTTAATRKGIPSGEADEDDKAVEESKPGERITVDGITFGDLLGGSDSEEDEGPLPSSGSEG